jgi:hypothetical protein
MKLCENCNKEHDGSYGSGRFCTGTCARGFSTKAKRKEINKSVSDKLTKYVTLTKKCQHCNIEFYTKENKNNDFCSSKCWATYRWTDDNYRNTQTNLIRERCKDVNERIRLRDIGKIGGFGTKGYTDKGTYYQSILEKRCFEYLDFKTIKYTPHKNIPNSTKVSDIYLDDYNIWVELDGINREVRKKWLGKNYDYWIEKLNIYKNENLKMYVIKTYKEFIKIIDELI